MVAESFLACRRPDDGTGELHARDSVGTDARSRAPMRDRGRRKKKTGPVSWARLLFDFPRLTARGSLGG